MAEQRDFWHRICEAVFIKSPRWFTAIRSLPDKLDLKVVLRRTVSGESLTTTGIKALGWVGLGIREEINPNPLLPTDFPMPQRQWAWLQFFCQFLQFEGLYNYLASNGLSAPELWDVSILTQYIELIQTMTFYAAMLIITEEGRLPEHESDIEPLIRDEVRKICDLLTSKTTDYGQAFLRHGVIGLLYRVWDKIARYATLSAANRASRFESRKDTASDMLGYSVLIWSILEDMQYTRQELESYALGEPL